MSNIEYSLTSHQEELIATVAPELGFFYDQVGLTNMYRMLHPNPDGGNIVVAQVDGAYNVIQRPGKLTLYRDSITHIELQNKVTELFEQLGLGQPIFGI
jgi:hypothetical protein